MPKKEPNLDYLNKVTPEMVEGLFFMDYHCKKEIRWVRSPYLTAQHLAIYCATMDWSQVSNFRIHNMVDLIEPVDKDGKTKEVCEYHKEEFVPVYQLAEYIFDSRYAICPEMIATYLEGSLQKDLSGCYLGDESKVTLITNDDLGSHFVGTTPFADNQLFEISMLEGIEQTKHEFKQKYGEDGDFNHFLYCLLESANDEFYEQSNLYAEDDKHPAVDKFDGMLAVMKKV